MKFLLLKHRFTFIFAKVECLAIETVAAALQANSVDFIYYDENFLKGGWAQLKKTIIKNEVTHLGISTNPNDVNETLMLARKIKTFFPNLYVIVGGNNAEIKYALYFDNAVDLIYHDNGLNTFVSLLKAHFSHEAIKAAKGVCYREEGKWYSNEKGEPVSEFEFEPLRLTDYKKTYMYKKGNYALIKGSWSCPYKCNFCNCRKLNNGKYTQRDLNNLINEIEKIECNKIWIVDDVFFVDKKRAEDFCNAVIERKINKQFMAYSRADFISANPDLLPLIKRAGFADIMIGFEAIEDDILASFDKQATKEINETCAKNLRENGINCVGSFILTENFTRKNFRDLNAFMKRYDIKDTLVGPMIPLSNPAINPKHLDGVKITFKPLNMTKLEYKIRFYMFYVRFFLRKLFV